MGGAHAGDLYRLGLRLKYKQEKGSSLLNMVVDSAQEENFFKWGFTLLELMIVIGIMGVLSIIAESVYSKYVSQAKNNICINDIRGIQQEIELLP
jgi:prepilin-type N-terminal cleavage/methylation domain-containing protein